MTVMKIRSVIVILAVALCFQLALGRLEQGRRTEGKQQLEAALRRTAAACYGAEGFYPPNVEYMMEHYGLQYDQEEYWVHYELFASNLMPEITVVERSK